MPEQNNGTQVYSEMKQPTIQDFEKMNDILSENIKSEVLSAQAKNKKESYPCHRCGEHGYKTDGKSRIWCKKCLGLLRKADTLTRNPRWQQRNDLCLCGSGMKFKKCCMLKIESE